MRLVLASASQARRSMLANAGLRFDVVPADIDERAVERGLVAAGSAPRELAMELAAAKAGAVSRRSPQALVIGADQVLELDGEAWSKPADRDGARRQLAALSGRIHALHSACVCARGGAVVWRALETARLSMRPLDAGAIERYLDAVGDEALESVGAYKIEGVGIQLFDSVEGDFFVILGLPLLPLLLFLRSAGAIA